MFIVISFDHFLMNGGKILLRTSPSQVTRTPGGH